MLMVSGGTGVLEFYVVVIQTIVKPHGLHLIYGKTNAQIGSRTNIDMLNNNYNHAPQIYQIPGRPAWSLIGRDFVIQPTVANSTRTSRPVDTHHIHSIFGANMWMHPGASIMSE